MNIEETIRSLALITDVFFVLISTIFLQYTLISEVNFTIENLTYITSLSLILLFFNFFNDRYFNWISVEIPEIFKNLSFAWLCSGSILYFTFFYALKFENYNLTFLIATLTLSFFLSLAFRIIFKILLWHYKVNGKLNRGIFIIGDNYGISNIAKQLRNNRKEGYSVTGLYRIRNINSPYDLIDLVRKVRKSDAREVWICLPLVMGNVAQSLLYALRNEAIDVRFLPDLKDFKLLNHRVSQVVGRYSIDLSVTPISGQARFLKRLEDVIISSVILILVSPLCLAIILAIKLTSKGPILFKQLRTGANGQNVKVYKFRSMKVHQEKEGQITQATKNDTRLSPIGGFLRRTSLDELPQFINVLQGRMSIVGPRPHALAHNEYYKDLVESYMRRHMVKPGITGWAQVNGYRGETDTLDKMQKRVEYDLWYIDNWSLWLDIKIIVATAFKGFINKNAY